MDDVANQRHCRLVKRVVHERKEDIQEERIEHVVRHAAVDRLTRP